MEFEEKNLTGNIFNHICQMFKNSHFPLNHAPAFYRVRWLAKAA